MDSVERRRSAIVDFINQHSSITFAELKKEFAGVSEMTLRTDLRTLDRESRIIRVHGGAKSMETVVGNDPYLGSREVRNVEAKQIIVEKALRLIHPGSTLFLDSGSTTTMLAKNLPNQPLLIYTSSITCAAELARLDQVRVYLPGGAMNRFSMSICGTRGIEELEKVNFDLALLGVTSFSEKAGFTCGSAEEAVLKRTALSRADQRYVLMDSSKIGTRNPFTFGLLNEVDGVVTDGKAPADFLAACQEAGIQVL